MDRARDSARWRWSRGAWPRRAVRERSRSAPGPWARCSPGWVEPKRRHRRPGHDSWPRRAGEGRRRLQKNVPRGTRREWIRRSVSFGPLLDLVIPFWALSRKLQDLFLLLPVTLSATLSPTLWNVAEIRR